MILAWVWAFNPYNTEIFLYKPWSPKGFSQFEISINVFVNTFRSPMLWVCGHYKYFYSSSVCLSLCPI